MYSIGVFVLLLLHASVLLFCGVQSSSTAQPPQCTYQDKPLKETPCSKLTESTQYMIQIKKHEHKHFHFRIEDLSLISHAGPTIHLRASPCSGGIFMWAKTNPFPFPNEFDYRFEANNTEPGSIKKIDTRMYNRDYYITISGFTDANVSLVAYTSRSIKAAPTRPGEFGYVEAKQELLTVPAVKVKFRASEWDKNAMYQVYKSLIVEDNENSDEGDENSTKSSKSSNGNLISNLLKESEETALPVCQDYWASRPCQIMYTACGVEQFGTPLDDGGFEPKSNGTLVMKVFSGNPGEKYFVNVIVKGGNGILSAYAGAQVFIANKPTKSAVDSDTQIIIISIVSAVFGGLALIMAFAWFKLKRAVNMKDPTKKKKKKDGKKKQSAKEELSKILKSVNPSSTPISRSSPSAATTKPKPTPPPKPSPKPPPKLNNNVGLTTKPPPGPPPKSGMRSKYVVSSGKTENEDTASAAPRPPPPPLPKQAMAKKEETKAVKPGLGSKIPRDGAVVIDSKSSANESN